jgi:hypothetical protein
LEIGDAHRSWCKKCFGKDIDSKEHVVPIGCAFQGHSEGGALWERRTAGILDDLGFKAATHERNLCHGEINGKIVFVCRQADNFAIACESQALAEQLISKINDHVTTESKGIGAVADKGASIKFNRVDALQTRDCVKLSWESHIDRVLQTHGWTEPEKRTSDHHDMVPLSETDFKSLQSEQGPVEGTPEHADLQAQHGFSYRQVICAHVVCCLDVGYAVTFLAQFAQDPASGHCSALKQVCRCLRRTKDWGLVHWRRVPREDLPHVSLPQQAADSSLPIFPRSSLLQLIGFVDAAHAADLKTHQSVAGLVLCLAGGAVAYKSKVQATVATSSTESEFIAAVHAAKVAKYLRSVLAELGFPQTDATVPHEDNQAAIFMVNEKKPAPRVRHVDIQCFVIQEWRERKIVRLEHIPTALNPADAATKALGWTLHHRQVRRAMGHYGRPDL